MDLVGGLWQSIPLMEDSDSSFVGQEYLGLYPKVEKGYYSDNGGLETFVK